jgi:hypothetical protein
VLDTRQCAKEEDAKQYIPKISPRGITVPMYTVPTQLHAMRCPGFLTVHDRTEKVLVREASEMGAREVDVAL